MVRISIIILFISYLNFELMAQKEAIRYVALGDSYTIGEGTTPDKSWPAIMTKNLNKEGVKIELIANPSVTGWTSKDLIEKELPVFDSSDADFVTLLIGVNDWVQEVNAEEFKKNLTFILDHVQSRLENPEYVLLVTIPDFSVTPDGPKYSKGRDISAGLIGFNKIILAEARSRGLTCVDLFEVSQEMKGKPDLIADDDLHPSAKTYKRWEEVIRPSALNLLK